MMNATISAVVILIIFTMVAPVMGAILPIMPIEKVGLSTEPEGLEAIAVASSEIQLYWIPEQFKDQESIAIIRDGTCIATTSSSSKFYHDTGLTPDRVYSYQIASLVGNAPDMENASTAVYEKTYPSWQSEAQYDVIVVGGTASGVAAARTSAMLGSKVALIEDTNRLGGMSSNGLGRPDIRDNGVRSSGFFLEMRRRITNYYNGGNGLAFEPKVANAVVKSMLYEYPNITILRKVIITDVTRDGRSVVGVKLATLDKGLQASFYATVVIDATVEGDVASMAGCRCRIGREPRSKEEPHNGHIFYDNQTDEILPGSTGKGDNKLQSYAYLLTVKDYGPDEDKTIPQPPDYDKNNYLCSPEWKKSWAFSSGKMPNDKYEINQHPWGTDLPGINYNYHTADREERNRIADKYRNHGLGYLYYLQTEQSQHNLGLADDEYPDTDNFPPTLYVREARRVDGLRIMNESDVWKAREFVEPQSIAIGDYPMDSHAVTNPPSPDVRHRGEGEWWLVRYTPWYHIPSDILVPQGIDGLLVSSAVSATHVAYGTLRMEPVRMSMGEAAGVIANLAVTLGIRASEVPPALVQDRLLNVGSYITWYKDVNPDTPRFAAIQFMGVRGLFSGDEFKPGEQITASQAVEWITALAKIEGRKISPALFPVMDDSSPVSRGSFAEWLVISGQPAAAADAFVRTGTSDSCITRAEAAYGLFLAHRDYALGSNAFTDRINFLRKIGE